jgi:GNAT superfamily N-acetyltransferase
MDDAERLAAVRNSAFDAGWSAAFREEVMRKPGYHPERELLVVAPGGQVAAFTVTWLDELNKVGHFEPVGTHRGFRRRGLGRALLLHGLRELRRLGMETATVQHDAATWRRATSTAASASSNGTRPSGSGAPIERRPGRSARRPRRPSLSQYER